MGGDNRTWIERLYSSFADEKDQTEPQPIAAEDGQVEPFDDGLTPVVDEPLRQGINLSRIRQRLSAEMLLLDAYAREKGCDKDVSDGLQELHMAYTLHDESMVPYTPNELLSELLAGQNIDSKLEMMASSGCSISKVVRRMAEDREYMQRLQEIYDNELPRQRLLKRFR